MTMILFSSYRSSRRGGRKCKPFLHSTSRFFSSTPQSQGVRECRGGSQYCQNAPSKHAPEGVSNLKNCHLCAFGLLKLDLSIVWTYRLLSRKDMSLGKALDTYVMSLRPIRNFLQSLKVKQSIE